jgi:hypothetical protein
MRKWWWWWLPGWHKKWKLEKRRIEALSEIIGERLLVEVMAQRPRRADDILDSALLEKVVKRITEIEESAKQAANTDDLDDLTGDAEQQGQLRAYLCPREEIGDEGALAIDLMKEWNVPEQVITKLRGSLGQKLEKVSTDQEAASVRGALRAIFEEKDSWSGYTEDYEKKMQLYTYCLFWITIVLLLLAIFAFRSHWPPIFLGGLLFAGAGGSCVSVMAKMPVLEVSLSGELESYGRRIWSRIGAGVAASLIGCALLGWGLIAISIGGQAFRDVLSDCCSPSPSTPCTCLKTLILLAVPMLFGFSERALTSFERTVFVNAG